MEKIRQAVEQAKAARLAGIQPQERMASALQQPQILPYVTAPAAPQLRGKEVALDRAQLESNRIIAHDIADLRSKTFDMLRTQVLQSMDMKSWQFLGITSPTAGCGKTVVSINLALSIARQQDRAVLLLDLDLQKPQIANYLGLRCDQGVLSVLEGRTDLPSSVIQARIGNQLISVLPCETATLNSSEWMASRSMNTLLQNIKQDFRNSIVIVDLPPVLIGDDVISILPQIDCVLFVAAIGTSTISDIKESNRHLESTSVVRFVLNKSSDLPAAYYSRYAENQRRKR